MYHACMYICLYLIVDAQSWTDMTKYNYKDYETVQYVCFWDCSFIGGRHSSYGYNFALCK